MNKYYFLITGLLFNVFAFSQETNVVELLNKKHIPCVDVFHNSLNLIPDNYNSNNIEVVIAIMQYWQTKCDISEPLLRLKILLAIKADTLNESLLKNAPVLNYLINYRDNKRNEINTMDFHYNHYYRISGEEKKFNDFTKKLALEIIGNKININSLSRFFLDFYSDNFENKLLQLNQDSFPSETLQDDYKKRIQYYNNLTQGHFALYTGFWIPSGNINILGNHPIIGCQGGLKQKKIRVDLAVEFKFLNSQNTYLTVKSDSIYSTNYFFGGYFGAEVGYELLKTNTFEFDFLAGIGWDGFDALSIDQPNSKEKLSKSINSLNLNFGVGLKKFIIGSSYLGLDVRYNLVDYKNAGGTSLNGNTFSIRIKYGGLGNYRRNNTLKKLDYIK
ncbi:MAG: hypothetical protein ACJAUV_000987 [Flavobacteriales bacterium]|jgi:hypothetical protein